MSTPIKLFLLSAFSFCCSFAQTTVPSFEKTDSFYPDSDRLKKEQIEWGYFTVPEDWENANGKTIQLAVAILKNTSGKENANPLVMLEGGPGASAVGFIWPWLNHPIRKNTDIVLMDVRGTGFSRPQLCPDLGEELLKILAKDQSAAQDEKDKTLAAIACKQKLIADDIDIKAYHSKNIARDLNALKTHLKYKSWNVYSVSYGTYMAQVYANAFPEDIKTLILDSPIADMSRYYDCNTSNYMNSLNKVFEACKNDPLCDETYPDLRNIYYKTIEKLSKNPITVNLKKSIAGTRSFTYNAEDFKIAIHQALYQKKLIEVLPLLIYQFYNENTATLGALVAAFSGALELEYGMYYCVSCNEAIPNNSLQEYNEDAATYPSLKGGLSFYKSDFAVCDQWNDQDITAQNELLTFYDLDAPVLIFSGGFDPITPASNGEMLNSRLKTSYLVNAPSSGHAPSFSRAGNQLVTAFIDAPDTKPDTESFTANSDINFVSGIRINGGISEFGNSLNDFDLLFLFPLLIAFVISLIAVFTYITGLIRNKTHSRLHKMLKALIILSSLSGVVVMAGFILALSNTASDNFYILAFGLPEHYNYLFTVLYIFLGALLLTLGYFFVNLKKIKNRSIMFTVLFSNLLIGIYLYYWGVFSIV